jgi:hypothetical protein
MTKAAPFVAVFDEWDTAFLVAQRKSTLNKGIHPPLTTPATIELLRVL